MREVLTKADRKVRQRIVEEYKGEAGDICPGRDVPTHYSRQLVVVADDLGGLVVLCPRCAGGVRQ